jgi:hypothetical protein
MDGVHFSTSRGVEAQVPRTFRQPTWRHSGNVYLTDLSNLTYLTKGAFSDTIMIMNTKVTQNRYVDRASQGFLDELERILGDEVPTDNPELLGQRAALSATAGLRWSGLVGPFTDSTGAATALGVSRQAVQQRLGTASLLGLRLAGHDRPTFVFPVWQFDRGVLEHIGRVIATAGYDRDRPTTGWSIASWLTTSDPRLDDRTPLDLLRAGQAESVLGLARIVADEFAQ